MGLLCSVLVTDPVGTLGKMIIRPPRAEYNLSELGPSRFRMGNTNYERVDLQLVNDRGLRLECSHYRPAEIGGDGGGKKKRLPCVIYIHGHNSSRLEARDAVRLLLPRNITVFCLDLAGSGLSEGEFVSLGHFEERDIQIVIEHLRGMPSVGTIGLWGRSMGAAIAVSCAAKNPLVAACVLDSAFSSLPVLAQELTTKRKGALAIPQLCFHTLYGIVRQEVKSHAGFDIEDLLPIQAAPDATSPALFVVAKDDDYVPPHHTYDLHNAWGGKDKMLVTTEGGHAAQRPKMLMDYVGQFLQKRLESAVAAKCEDTVKTAGLERRLARIPSPMRLRGISKSVEL